MRDGNDTVPAPSDASGMSDLAAHVAMVHTLAAPLASTGKLIVASFGEDPATGKPLSPKIEHFRIGDVIGMVSGIERLARDRHRNVYVPLAVMSLDLAPSKKGFEGDIFKVPGTRQTCDMSTSACWALWPISMTTMPKTTPAGWW
jgi:hypothetical protein